MRDKEGELSLKPNILLLMTDQQSATMMSCAGNAFLRTPAMDSIAERGVRFERAYCTNPVCLPSRVGMMTGRLPGEFAISWNNGDTPIPPAVVQNSLGRLAERAGYETAYGGKVHLPWTLQPADMGFDVLCQDDREDLALRAAEFVRQPHDRPWLLVASFVNPHDICYMAIRDRPEERHKAVIAERKTPIVKLDQALELPPGVSEDEFYERYCPPVPPNFDVPAEEPEMLAERVRNSPFRHHARREWPAERWRLHRWAYCRLTEMADAHIAKILDALRESGQEGETVVIFTSDHGDHDGAHRLEHKTSFYEESIRIPLIVSDPRRARTGHADSEHIVSNGLDLIPTVCDYMNVAAPAGLRGRSLRPLVQGDVTSWRAHLPVESTLGRMVVTGHHKYLLYDSGARREQLIDRVEDPGEMHNAAARPDKQDVLAEHRRLFRETFGEDEPA